MKLQGVSVIFALIVLPLILVLTYYIQLQVDTIQMQNQYDIMLLNATYDAMSAFEINTANEDLSTVSDSLRTIIDASTNVFMNTLSTNLGMSNASQTYLEPYIPSILYTLYDGYYICAPTRTPTVLTDSDGNALSVGDIGVTFDGSQYKYKEVHTDQESQDNCSNCVGHITYETYKNMSEDEIIGNPPSNDPLIIKYEDLEGSDEKEQYGQLLYVTPSGGYTTNVNDAEFHIDHVLKSYMPYSARYVGSGYDITAIYTLDNYLTIEGTIGDIYYTKSGYFIPSGTVSIQNINGVAGNGLLQYNQNDAKNFIEAGNYVEIKVDDVVISSGTTDSEKISKLTIEEEITGLNKQYNTVISYMAQIDKYSISSSEIDAIEAFLGEETPNTVPTADVPSYLYGKLDELKGQVTNEINDRQYELDKRSAITYYVTAEIFSNWVYKKLVDDNCVTESNLVEISGQSYKMIKGEEEVGHDYNDASTPIFDIVGTESSEKLKLDSIMEIDKDSPFYTHKLNVIRDSIQYNLNLAMSTYNNMLIANNDYAMPVMQNEEWERILSNVSIVSFMQGYNCGLKEYNNYKIASSTNNEISVFPSEIYYVEKSEFSNEEAEYHKIDCPKLLARDAESPNPNNNEYIAFVSKEVKYDKIYDKTNMQAPYKYDHKNYACYDCINDGNYTGIKLFDTADANYSASQNLRKAYYIGVGKARNNLYKMNAIVNSEGYEIILDTEKEINKHPEGSSLTLREIKSIEIVFDTIKTSDSEETTLKYTVGCDGTLLNNFEYTIVPNVTTKTTIKVDVDPTISDTSKVKKDNLQFTNLFENSTIEGDIKDSIVFIRVLYK